MTQLTDLQLVEQYQNTRKDVYFNTLVKRYEGFIKNKTSKLYKNQRLWDDSLGFDDIKQEILLRALETVNKVKIDKIKDKDKFSFSVPLYWQIKNWEVTHKNYMYKDSNVNLDPDARGQEVLKRYQDITTIVYEFGDTLKGVERVVWDLLMQGNKKGEIAKSIKMTACGVSGVLNRIKRKYKEFTKIK